MKQNEWEVCEARSVLIRENTVPNARIKKLPSILHEKQSKKGWLGVGASSALESKHISLCSVTGTNRVVHPFHVVVSVLIPPILSPDLFQTGFGFRVVIVEWNVMCPRLWEAGLIIQTGFLTWGTVELNWRAVQQSTVVFGRVGHGCTALGFPINSRQLKNPRISSVWTWNGVIGMWMFLALVSFLENNLRFEEGATWFREDPAGVGHRAWFVFLSEVSFCFCLVFCLLCWDLGLV